jgi:hypothetical protein
LFIMTIKRVLQVLGVLLAYGVFIFLAYLWVTPHPPQASRIQVEQEIYSVLLNSPYIRGSNVWGEHTSLGDVDLSPDTIQYIKNLSPSIMDSTLNDFQKSNRQSHFLKGYLPANNDYLFLSDAEVELLFSDWEAFSNEHPDVVGFISLSKIGFDSSYTQALVLRSSYNKLFDAPFEYGGHGLLFLFRKIGVYWVEQDVFEVSITG